MVYLTKSIVTKKWITILKVDYLRCVTEITEILEVTGRYVTERYVPVLLIENRALNSK